MNWGLWHSTGDRDQDYPQERVKQKSETAGWGALQITVTRKVKSKGEKERYTHLNAEFQTIARIQKKAFLSDHCKEIEENNRMGNTRDIFRKIRDTISCKDGHNKGQKWYRPNRSRRIEKMWQEYTKEIYEKRSSWPKCIINHLEPDILESEVKWALESITTNKAIGVKEFQLSYFRS